MTIIYVLAAILLLGILVMIHEFGHFIAARMTGIDVVEFSIGFGPKLLGWKGKKHETAFSLRAIPMGGYCMFYGEDDAEGKHTDDPRAYNRQSVWKRMFTVLMGPAMNFALAFVVAVFYFFSIGVYEVQPYIYIDSVQESGAAAQAGLQAGDAIYAIQGEELTGYSPTALTEAMNAAGGRPVSLSILRNGTEIGVKVTPAYDEEAKQYLIGVVINAKYQDTPRPISFGEAISRSAVSCWNAAGLIVNALKDLVTTGEGLDQTAGPVGVVQQITIQTQQGGMEAYINLLVMISINLGVMNLLPIPGLDGSRFLFMLVEAIRGKPVAPKKEAMVHLAGMVLLFGVMIFFTFKDVIRIFQ